MPPPMMWIGFMASPLAWGGARFKAERVSDFDAFGAGTGRLGSGA